MDSATGGSVPVLFFFQSNNVREIKYLLKRDGFDLPVCIDSNDELNKLNNFSSDPLFQTFLLDTRIIVKAKVIGNPIHNLKVRDIYINARLRMEILKLRILY